MTENNKERNTNTNNNNSYTKEEIQECAARHIQEWTRKRQGEKFYFDKKYPSYWVRYDGNSMRYDGVITHRFSGRCREYNFGSYAGVNMIQACMEFFVEDSEKEKWKGR